MDSTENNRREKTAVRIRRINAAVAASLVVFFLVHACLGSIEQIQPIQSSLRWITWIFAGLILVHIALTVATSYYMMTDSVRPPSKAKVRHLILKWVSGGILLLLALLHVFGFSELRIPLMVGLLGVIVWHSFVGVKSLIRDLNMPRELKMPIRVALIVIGAIIASVALAGMILSL